MIKKFLRSLILTYVIGSQIGCSFVMPNRQSFTVTASEPSAKIYINGAYMGTGAVSTKVPRNQNVSVMAKLDGYRPATREVDTTMSMVGILDLIGGWCFLLPFLGLLAPGSRELDTTNLSIILDKEETKN